MDSKQKIIVAWRFESEISEISFAEQCVKPIAVGDGLIPEEKKQDIMNELRNSTSNITVFVHRPSSGDAEVKKAWQKQMDELKRYINREKRILVLEFGGGNETVYAEFIDQKNKKLKDSEITSRNIEGKIKNCIEKCDITPKLIQLKKRLFLEKIKGKSISEDMLDGLKGESDDLKVAINTFSENMRKDVNALLNHISNQVEKYGA